MIFVLIAGFIVGYNVCQYHLLIFLVVNQFLSGFILYLRSNISGLLMFKADSFLSVSDRLLMIICCGILLWGNVTDTPFQIEWFVYTQTFAYILTIAIALLVILGKTKLRFPYVDYEYFKYIFRKSFPFALLTLFTSLHNRIDVVFLERLLPNGIGAEQAGIYGSAFRLLDAAIIVAYLFSVLLVPIFARMTEEKESVSSLVKTSFTLIFIYGVIVALLSYYYSYPLIEILYHNHVEQSSHVFRILILSIIPISMTYIFGSLLTANGNLKQLNLIAFFAMLLNMVLNMVLIPYYLAMGPAIASICTQLFIIILEIIISVKVFSLKVSRKYIIRLICFLLFSILAVGLSLRLPFTLVINFISAFFICISLVFIFGLVKPKEIISLLKK
jgi:O-antigen/teichoic acid export membrane protein